MESDNTESPNKQRLRQNQPKRDQPLFASRRSRPSLQQAPDFLTESVNTSRNTSYIPSPSPEKSPTRESLRARPRQALDRKSFKNTPGSTTPRVNNENRSPSLSHSQWLRDRSTQSHRSSLRQRAGQGPSKSPAKLGTPAKSPVRTRTPTPPRGRTLVPESPANSESSPGRGYAEAYQRIVEEENLAQEESIDDMDLEDFAHPQDEVSQDIERLRIQHRHSSSSPRSLRTLRKTSPRVSKGTESTAEEMDKENRAVDQDSVSDMAPTESDTHVSNDSGSSQYARDMQRLNNALKCNGQAFSKARLGPKAGLPTRNPTRSNGSIESLESTHSSESLSQKGTDPPVNVPKAWGRKAKPGKDWLTRINSRSGRFTGDPPKRSPSGDQLIAESTKRDSGDHGDNSIAAAEVPLPESSSVDSSSPPDSRPTTSDQYEAHLNGRSKWELIEDEFTGRSLQVSESPPLRIRNSALDKMREREIENLEKRAVTTNRLGELRERISNPQLLPYEISRVSVKASSTEWLSQGKDDTGNQARRASSTDEAIPSISQENLGEPIPDTPIVVFRKTSTSSGGSSKEHAQAADRPSHRRGESHNLLKRLARVSSQSPSPGKGQTNIPDQTRDQVEHVKVEVTPAQPEKSKVYEQTPIVTGAWVEQTPGPTPDNLESKIILKTPFVTGAWIETPLPTGGRGPPMPTPADPEENRQLGSNRLGAADLITKLSTSTPRPSLKSQKALVYTGPPLPKSALEEIINDARSGKLNDTRPDLDSAEEPTLHLGESTIQSLEDLVANDTDYSTLLATSLETSPLTSDPSPSSSDPRSKAQGADQDPQSYTQLLSRLTNLAPSIRASKRQLASLEQTVASTNPQQITKTERGECNEAGEFHDFIWPCPRCHCPGRLPPLSVDSDLLMTTTINLTIPRLWSWQPHDWRPRLTRLGTLLLCIYAYCFAENWAQYVIPLSLYPLSVPWSLPLHSITRQDE